MARPKLTVAQWRKKLLRAQSRSRHSKSFTYLTFPFNRRLKTRHSEGQIRKLRVLSPKVNTPDTRIPATSPHPPTPSRFLSLPREIRQMILLYTHELPGEDDYWWLDFQDLEYSMIMSYWCDFFVQTKSHVKLLASIDRVIAADLPFVEKTWQTQLQLLFDNRKAVLIIRKDELEQFITHQLATLGHQSAKETVKSRGKEAALRTYYQDSHADLLHLSGQVIRLENGKQDELTEEMKLELYEKLERHVKLEREYEEMLTSNENDDEWDQDLELGMSMAVPARLWENYVPFVTS